jgi:murein DD-endopeptidase MepM/ murein hydrolase activator NlpD
MVYTLQSGNADGGAAGVPSNVLIQDGTLNPNSSLSGANNSSASLSNYKEFGTTLDIKSSRNQQSKQVILKQDQAKLLLDKYAPFEWYYFYSTADQSKVKVDQGRISNTNRVLQNGEQDNPTRTTSFTLARNSTSKTPAVGNTPAVDKKNMRDEDGAKKGIVNGTANSDCTRTTNDAISTTLGVIPATVNRKIGVCDDGLYKVNSYAVDSSGNYAKDGSGNPVVVSKVVERDTVSPAAPTVTNKLNGDILGQTLSMGISGEANTIATIKVGIEGEKTKVEQVYGYRLDSSGNYNSGNLLGQLSCDTSYTLDVTLTDRAGNVSSKGSSQFRTMTCPVCPVYKVIDKSNEQVDQGKASGKYQVPIRGVAPPSGLQLYGSPRELNGRPFSHEGVDFNGAGNPPTYPIATGNVVFARWNGAYGNMVKVDHGNGTRSEYGHLDSISVKEGQTVFTDTILGIVGNTGNSFGAHLHLNISVNGKQVNPLTILDTNYSYTPTVVDANNRYAVLQLSPGTLSVDEARRFGCDVPNLPRDPALELEQGVGDFVSTAGDDDDLIELASLDSDQIDVTSIIDKIAGNLRDDFNYYFKLTTSCDWYNVDCHKANAVNLIEKVKRFLELLIRGMINGLSKAGSNLVQEFQNIFNTLKDLINDPVKTITEAVKEVQKMFENVLAMISKAGDFLKIVVNNIKDFLLGDRESRITSLGSAFGLFIGEKIADAVKGALSGGPIAAIANVIKGIFDKLKDIAKVVIKTIQLVGERIAIGVSGVLLTIKKSITNRIGILVSEIRKYSLEAIEGLPISQGSKTYFRDLRRFDDIYSTLKTPDWMTKERIQHILMGDPRTRQSGGGGGHHLKSIGGGNTQYAGNVTNLQPSGIYQAEVKVYDTRRQEYFSKPIQTMFPDKWSQQDLIDHVNGAKNAVNPSDWIRQPNGFSVVTVVHNNIKTKIVLYANGTLNTAYPLIN